MSFQALYRGPCDSECNLVPLDNVVSLPETPVQKIYFFKKYASNLSMMYMESSPVQNTPMSLRSTVEIPFICG